MSIEMKPWIRVVGVACLCVVIGLLSYRLGLKSGQAEIVYVGETATTTPLGPDFKLFWQTYDLLKKNYVNESDLKSEDLTLGAIEGMVNAAGDPYTVFLPPSDAEKFREDIEGSFGGIGAEIGVRNKQLVIIAPLKGNPAEEAGLKPGDAILRVDDTVVSGDMTIDEAVGIIRGDPGTKVRLLVYRELWQEPKEFTITRRVIVAPTVDMEMKGEGIGYVRIYSFNANLPSLFSKVALEMLIKGVKGIIVDLRNNPGGYLEVVNDIGGWFLPKGSVITEERLRGGEGETLRTAGKGALKNIPVVVLVNGGSASAAEILAGSLRDLRGAKLIGEKTFGKGSVQEIKELDNGASLKVTVAEWLTPNKTAINKKGLEPDIAVSSTLKESDYPTSTAKDGTKDPQYEKALEILKSLMNQAALKE